MKTIVVLQYHVFQALQPGSIDSASSSTAAGSSLPSTSESIFSLPQEESNTTAISTSPSDIATHSLTTSLTYSSFGASSSFPSPTLSTTGLQSPTSSATSSSQAYPGSSARAGLVYLVLMVPAVLLFSFRVCRFLWRKLSKSPRCASKGGVSLPEAATLPSHEQSQAYNSNVANISASDSRSTHSQFSSLPKYPQAKLKNRTAESDLSEE